MAVRVACVQFAPEVGDGPGNRRRAREAVREAVSAGARLVVLPELCTAGYVFESPEEARSVAERPDGPALRDWAEEAAKADAVVVGGFAELVHGSGRPTRGIDIVPSLRPENLRRLQAALEELGARGPDGRPVELDEETVRERPVTAVQSERGELKIVPVPAGTRGFDDLRRGASREPLGRGIRAPVAGLPDVIRSLDALGRREDEERLPRLRRLAELQRDLELEL